MATQQQQQQTENNSDDPAANGNANCNTSASEESSTPAVPRPSLLRNSLGETPRSASERRLLAETEGTRRVSISLDDNDYISHRIFNVSGRLVEPLSVHNIHNTETQEPSNSKFRVLRKIPNHVYSFFHNVYAHY